MQINTANIAETTITVRASRPFPFMAILWPGSTERTTVESGIPRKIEGMYAIMEWTANIAIIANGRSGDKIFKERRTDVRVLGCSPGISPVSNPRKRARIIRIIPAPVGEWTECFKFGAVKIKTEWKARGLCSGSSPESMFQGGSLLRLSHSASCSPK